MGLATGVCIILAIGVRDLHLDIVSTGASSGTPCIRAVLVSSHPSRIGGAVGAVFCRIHDRYRHVFTSMGRFPSCLVAANDLDDHLRMCLPCGGVFHAQRHSPVWLVVHFGGIGTLHLVESAGWNTFVEMGACDHGRSLWGHAPGVWSVSVYNRTIEDCLVNPEPFLKLDRVIHEKGRLAIMSLLAASPQLSFTEMRSVLGMTDGNLSVHIRTLQEIGYLAVTKSVQHRKPLTTCALTPEGRQAFTDYINLLEQIVRQSKPEPS